jgi:hypothetical protein
VLDQVNGEKISRLQDLQQALQRPVKGFHVIQFFQSDTLRKMVLSADDYESATQRVLARYGITSDHYFASPQSEVELGVASGR